MKKILLLTILLGLAGCSLQLGGGKVADSLTLKVPKELILDYQEKNGVIEYVYPTDKEVVSKDYQGIKEDLSRRTNFSRSYKLEIKNGQEQWADVFDTPEPYFKNGDKWVYTGKATTTVEEFEKQTKPSIIEEIISKIFGKSILAASDTYTANGTWPSVMGVASPITVECWGGGGGGYLNSGNGGAGGGGGAYVSSSVAITSNIKYDVVVGSGGTGGTGIDSIGQNGATSTFASTVVMAAPGWGGKSMTSFGLGGAIASSTGDTKYAGGNGGMGIDTDESGGGGGAGGPDGAGNNGNLGAVPTGGQGGDGGTGDAGSGGTAGDGGFSGPGGAGGTSVKGGGGGGGGDDNHQGGAGGTYGGGGGGGEGSTANGSGADGACIITYSGDPTQQYTISTGPVKPAQLTTTAFGVRVAKLDTDKFVVCWANAAAGGLCKVGTAATSTDIVFGANSNFDAADVWVTTSGLDVSAINTDYFAVSFADDDDLTDADDGFTMIGSSTATTLNGWSSRILFDLDAEWISSAKLDTNKYVICYDDETDSDTGKCVINTFDGSTITVGTPIAMDGSSGAVDFYPYMTDTAKIASDRFVTCFQYEDLAGDPGWCAMATWSGTTPTFVATSSFTTTTIPDYTSVSSGGTNGDFWITWQNVNATTTGYILYATSSASQMYYGTPVAFTDTGLIQNNRVAAYNDNVAVSVVGDTLSGGLAYIWWADTSNNDVYYATTSLPVIFDTGPLIGGVMDMGLDIEFISTNKFVVCYQDDTDGDDLFCVIGNITPPSEPPAEGGVLGKPQIWWE